MRRQAAVLLVSSLALLAGCGRDPLPPPPPAVPVELVPSAILGDLGLEEFSGARQAFAEAGDSSLVADGRLWEIRRAETLVGTLQIATIRRELSTSRPQDRRDILAAVMTGASYETVDVDGVPVARMSRADKTLFVWFGTDLFEVLQLKGTKVDPDAVLGAIIEHQLGQNRFEPVGSVDDEEVAP